jgi:molybdopterin synthase catalytic subunit
MGERSARDWVVVTEAPLALAEIQHWVARDTCGAVVTFCGTVRNSSSTGQDIIALEYETSDELAEPRIAEVITEARRRWPMVEAIAVHHRVGRVDLGEVTVVVAVSSPHRGEAFEAGQYCIDTVKATVPMWKREIWEGGSVWSPEATPIADVRPRGR